MGSAEELTFRDFAGAVMQGDSTRASTVLQALLALTPDQATPATSHFSARMKDPAFMMKAMGLRTAVTNGTDEEIATLLHECFGLEGDARKTAVVSIRAKYPRA